MRAGSDHLDRLPRLLIPLAILLLPATCRVIAKHVSLAVSLVPFMLLIVATAITVRRFRFDRNPAHLAGWMTAPVMAVSLIASGSSGDGLAVTLSALCGGGIVLAAASWDRDDLARRIALPLLVTASFQSIIVIAQVATGRAVGLNWLLPTAELRVIDGLQRAQGTMSHTYEPPALALLAAGVALAIKPAGRRWTPLWVSGAALAGTTVGLTHSRAALLSLLVMIPFIIVAARRGSRHMLRVGGGLMAGFAIAAALTSSAWMHRVDHTTSGGLDDASLGRITLARQAIEMTADHPLLGVGPGRYLTVLESDYGLDERYPFHVHNVPLAVAAELGIPAAVLLSLLVGWAVTRAVRSGPPGAVLAISILGFVLFDALHYDRTLGFLMFGIWLAVLQHYQSTTSRLVRSS